MRDGQDRTGIVGRLDVEESSWSYEAADETDGETPVLQLDLMKKVRASEQEPLWGYILEAERTAASQQRGRSQKP